MRQGGEDLLRQFNKGTDYIQSSFMTSEGIFNKNVPNFIYKGIVIDVNFERTAPTTTAGITPPFSVYAKIIGMDEDTSEPELQSNRVYYPPLFPMHILCIPEIGEEVLILKENAEESSVGYYIGRANNCTPLNISYARDNIATNDKATNNKFRYGFSFDVRKLREQYEHLMPSDETNNISIPVIYGDVVQQGRSKTYLRHSFNRNNKKGVLESGISLPGQLAANELKNNFNYAADGSNNRVFDNVTKTYNYFDEETQETKQHIDVIDPDYGLPNNKKLTKSFDPSIGETSTKTIHFIDSSIKRLGDYNFQSQDGDSQSGLQNEDKSIIANLADEIYNISSKELSGTLYRQVLGEKLVNQQRQTFTLLNDVLTTVQGFAQTTQVLLDAFVDHTHALPKIDLNLKKQIQHREHYRTPDRFVRQPDRTIRTPTRTIRVYDGTRQKMVLGAGGWKPDPNSTPVPKYAIKYVAGHTISVPTPPRRIPGRMVTRYVRQQINFDTIIGGAENPRFTAAIETNTGYRGMSKTELGEKTSTVNDSLEKVMASFEKQQESLNDLSLKIANFLSKHQFVN